MKSFPIFKILYYGITVVLGVLLGLYMFSGAEQLKAVNGMATRNKEGDYLGVTKLLTVLQNGKEVLKYEDQDGLKVYVYETVSTYHKKETVDGKEKSYYLTEKSYFGIINGFDKWSTKEFQNPDGRWVNEMGVNFINEDNKISYYRIGVSQSDNENNLPQFTTYQNRYYSNQTCGFFYFLLTNSEFEANGSKAFNKIQLLNADKTVYKTIELSSEFSFTSDFFTVADNYNTNYNKYAMGQMTLDEFNKFSDEFLKSYTYLKSDYQEVVRFVWLENTMKLVVYAVVVLIIGDLLVGKRYLIALGKKIFVRKKKDSNSIEEDNIPEYMKNYEVNVTISAATPKNFDKDVVIKYHTDRGDSLEFVLNKANMYQDTQRIKNGDYANPEIKAEGLKCQDVPSVLKIKGYTYKATFVFENAEIIEEAEVK